MLQQTKTFRIFVSSTFTDMRVERRILLEDVFPGLKKFCEEQGALFQAIDLRWGVNEESQREQKTMDICLNEITRCQILSPRPNFIVLLGNRYGWQPLPDRVPSIEMDEIRLNLTNSEAKLIESWYKEDNNAIPFEYVLQPRGEKYRDYSIWKSVEDNLLEILRKAADKSTFPIGQKTKYFASATHQEIINGALKSSSIGIDPAEHVFAYIRSIDNLPRDKTAADFIDLTPEGTIDLYAKDQMEGLKKELQGKLPMEHIYKYPSQWNGTLQFDGKAFADRVYNDLKSVIEMEMKEIPLTDELNREKKIHADFRNRLTEFFTGREDVLRHIASYLEKGSNKPLALIGPSGSGKSSIMAKAMEMVKKGTLVFRFIGVTSASSNLNSLLSQLCEEITKAYNVEMNSLLKEGEKEEKLSTYEGLMEIFERCLNLSSEQKPLLIFLDALDQLQTPKYDFLNLELPDHVRIIVSALPELEGKLILSDIFILPLMEEETGKKLLEKWLLSEKRSLTKAQREEIIGKFKENGLPIYLKLAFEQVRKWHSYDKLMALPEDLEGVLAGFFDLLGKTHTEELVSSAIGYLLSGKYGGLTETEVLDILAFDSGYWLRFLESCHPAHRAEVEKAGKLPVVVWSRLYFDLEAYLTERDADNIKIITFFHRAFAEYARKRYPLKYTILAGYFEKEQPLYVNEKEKIPNIRKVVELPFQQTYGEKWDALEKTLTDLFFIEAKCRAGMVYELTGDYRLALAALPENKEKLREERERETHVQNWTTDMIAYAQAWSKRRDQEASGEPVSSSEPKLPLPVPSSRRWTDREIEAECQRIMEHPGRLNRLTAFQEFVTSQAYPLIEHGRRAGFILQHAFSNAPAGPVHDAAQWLLNGITIPLMLRRWPQHKSTNLKPALLQTIDGCSLGVVTITPDGRRAVSGSLDNTVQVWDLESGKCLSTLEGHSGFVLSVSITPDGKRAVSGSEDKTIRVWDLVSGKCLKTLNGHSSSVSSVSVTPDGRRAVSGSDDETLRVWDVESGKCISILEGHSSRVASVSMTPDGRRAVSGSWDNTLRVWDLESGKCLRSIAGQSDMIYSVSVTPDGKRAVSGSRDNTLRVWEIDSGICLNILVGHKSLVCSVNITPDGKLAVSGSWDKSLRVWDLESGKCLVILEGHSNMVSSVSITPDGRRTVSCGDNTLRLWNIESGKNQSTIEGHSDCVSTLSVSPNGRSLLSGSYDTTLRLWDIESGKCQIVLSGHNGRVFSASITSDGSRAISWSEDYTFRVWDIKSGKCLSSLAGKDSSYGSISIIPDGRRAVSGNGSNKLRVWDIETGEFLTTPEGHGSLVNNVSVIPDGRRAVSSDEEHTLRVWDIESGRCLSTLEGHIGWNCNVIVTSDGRRAVYGGDDCTLNVWDFESGKCLSMQEEQSFGVICVSLTQDGKRAVSAGGNTLQIWDIESGKCLGIFVSPAPVHSVTIFSDLVFAGTETGEVLFLELKNLIPLRPDITAVRLWLFDQQVWDAGLSASCPLCGGLLHPDKTISDLTNKFALQLSTEQSPSLDLPLKAWDDPLLLSECPHCHRPLRYNPFIVDNRDRSESYLADSDTIPDTTYSALDLPGHIDSINSLCITPDGKLGVSGSLDSTLRIWDLESGISIRTLEGHRSSVNSVSVTSDGRRAVSGSEDKTLRIWDLENGNWIRTMESHSDGVICVSVSPDGKFAVSASRDKLLMLWDLNSGKCLKPIIGHCDSVYTARITPDGRSVVSGGEEKAVHVWNIESGKCISIMEGHSDSISCISVTPDGRRAVSGSRDTVLRVWDLKNGKCLRTLEGHSDVVSCVNVTSDGSRVVSGSIDNTLRVWNIESGVCLLELVLAGPVHSFAIFSDLGLTGTETGEVSILELKDLILGRPIITIVRLWLFDLQAWDANLTTRCLWCGNSFLPDETVLEIINKFGSQLSPGQSPCMALASETWDDPRLISECPHCHKPLKYNPFIIDNRSKDDSL